jgi:hypothetical protein
MDGTGDHHLNLSEVSQAQKVNNLMFSLICSNIIGHGAHTKGRTCMGGLGKNKEIYT